MRSIPYKEVSVFLVSATTMFAMVRVLKYIFRCKKYAFVLLTVSLLYVAFLKSPIKYVEKDVEKSVMTGSQEIQPFTQAEISTTVENSSL